ncbi:hypothetical protein LCGC14_2070260 [marine sediment metagenome]|uniref:Uncharacterized protein n=1 Tax=marine sediment metagenome TaxID=412755 RepID=A0A0F9EII7_9ZZZZ
MEDFNPHAALLIVAFGSFFTAMVFFANSISINLKSKEKGGSKESRVAILWGFAFMLLGHLGKHFATG